MHARAARPKTAVADGKAVAAPLLSRHQPAGAPLRIQRKLSVGAANDPLEHEADRIADQVMRMPDVASAPRPAVSSAAPAATVLSKAASSVGAGAFAAPAIVHDVLNSPGQPLGMATRAFMEPRFGRDFSQVRVHTDRTATEAATAINARAFTAGHHVALGADSQPETASGRELLAHELAHVVQQTHGTAAAGASTLLRRAPRLVRSKEGDDPRAAEIRAKLVELHKFSATAIDEMMEIEGQMAGLLANFKSIGVDDIVTEIEMRYYLLQTMIVIAEYSKNGSFQFPVPKGYMISKASWKPLGRAYEASGPSSGLQGDNGSEFPLFSPLYGPSYGGAAAAIEEIFKANSKQPIVLDCNAMMVAMQYNAMRQAFGDKKFDKMFPEKKQGLFIGPVSDPSLQVYPDYNSSKTTGDKNHPFLEAGMYAKKEYQPGSFNAAMTEKSLIAGDWVYIANHYEYENHRPNGMWQGENAVYVGHGKFMGAGLANASDSTFTYDDILVELQREYDAVYDRKTDPKKPKAPLTKNKLPGLVMRMRPNMAALNKLPKSSKPVEEE